MRSSFSSGAFFKRHWPLFAGCLLLGALLWRDPFSPSSKVFDFLPYPDSFHYVLRARNLVQGSGFKVFFDGREIYSPFSPLYSLFLTPVYFFQNDPHAFYFANVLLSFLSLALFYLILRKLFGSPAIRFVLTFLLVTNPVFFTYPIIAAPGNLIFTLFLLAVYWLLQPVTVLRSVGAGLCAVSFFAAKYSAAPLTIFYFLLYGAKIVLEGGRERKAIFLSVLFSVFFTVFSAFSAFEFFLKQTTPFQQAVEVFSQIFLGHFTPKVLPTLEHMKYFNAHYFAKGLFVCLKGLLGEKIPYIAVKSSLFPVWLGAGGGMGLVLGFARREKRFLILALGAMLLGQVIFISFCSVFVRYLYFAIPVFLIGFGFLIEFLKKWCGRLKYGKWFGAFLIFCFLAGAIPVAGKAMKEIRMNFRPSEKISYMYGCVLELNRFFSDPGFPSGEKPVRLATTIPPPFFDFYGKPNCELLPFSGTCDYLYYQTGVWRDKNPGKVIDFLGSGLEQGKDVYIAILPSERTENVKLFKRLQEKFSLKLMKIGKFCHILRLEKKIGASSG
ncbi:MAG TPA: hypothetical protein PKL97_04340 [Candidatus Omnitrophota bacterium]|nr:hypothetical protein [Candidatus Omnitrophota bacterium]